MEGLTDDYSLLDNGLFNLVYPKGWECEFKEEAPVKITNLDGEGITVEIAIFPFGILNDLIEELVKDEIDIRGGNITHKSVTVDGIEGVVYTEEGYERNSLYWFRNGNTTVGVFVKRYADDSTDFRLEDNLRWKTGSNSHSDWLEEVKDLANLINNELRSEGKDYDFMTVEPEESLLITRSENYRKFVSRENAKETMSRFTNALQAMRNCAEHNYTFRIDIVDRDGKVSFSYTFTPDDYRIEQDKVIVE